MNSNRKKNLRKLARDLIGAVAAVSSISGAPTKANEIQPPREQENSSWAAWATPAVLGIGLAGIGYFNYKANQDRLATEKEFNQKDFELRQKEAEKNLRDVNNKRLLEENGMDVEGASTLCTRINKAKQQNNSKKLITTDDLIAVLKDSNCGEVTKDILHEMYTHKDTVDHLCDALVETLAGYYVDSDQWLSRLKDAVATLQSTITDGSGIKQSVLMICSGDGTAAGGRDEGNWANGNPANKANKMKQIGINAVARPMAFMTTKKFTPKNGNYNAGDKLLPSALVPLLGDMIWCGVATGIPTRADHTIHLRDISDGNMHRAIWIEMEDHDESLKNMREAKIPLYLSLTCNRKDADANGKLQGTHVWNIPLYDNLNSKRGDEKAPEIMPNVAKWIISAADAGSDSDRVPKDNADMK